MRNNLWDWQSLSPSSGYGTFFEFCDALEVKNGVSASAKGWGLQHALQAWGTFWNETYYAGREWYSLGTLCIVLTNRNCSVCGDSDQVYVVLIA